MPGVTGDSTPSLSGTCVMLGWIKEMGRGRKDGKGRGRAREELWPFRTLWTLPSHQRNTLCGPQGPVWTPQWPSGMNLGWDSVFLPPA